MSRTFITVLCGWLLWPAIGLAEDCPGFSYQLETSSDVSSLGAEACDTIMGNLTIGASNDIFHLDALVNLSRVVGSVRIINNSGLLNIDGLINLVEVGGDVEIDGNGALTNVAGLAGLETAYGLLVSSNPKLADLDGMESLETLTGDLQITGNDALGNLDGLSGLTSIGGDLRVQQNAALTNIDGLSNASLAGIDSGPDGPDPGGSGYCTSVPSDVVCDPNADGNYLSPGGTLDDWREKTGSYSGAPVPARKVLALPFTANAAGTKGMLSIGNNQTGFIDGTLVKGWFSETPGGPILNNADRWCRFYSNNPNPREIKWSQEATVGNFTCDLGQTERVLYFNMEVACYEAYVTSTSTCTPGQRFNEMFFFSIGNI
ncbi:hypothetical protein N9U42_04325 [Luminiphilus sp.]|nr:hypothetical protein [Luminiphilus sp.]MDA9711577.1 hypothetical protein [Luminiphilus sp.]